MDEGGTHVLRLVVPSNKVVNGIGMSQTLLNLVRPSKIPFLSCCRPSVILSTASDASKRLFNTIERTHQRGDLPEIPTDPQMPFLVLIAVRDDNVRTRLRCIVCLRRQRRPCTTPEVHVPGRDTYRVLPPSTGRESWSHQILSRHGRCSHSVQEVLARWQACQTEECLGHAGLAITQSQL